jgi:hypothetical protein
MLAIEHIRTCLILHNLALDIEHLPDNTSEWDWVIAGGEVDGDGVVLPVEEFLWDGAPVGDVEGGEKRRMVQAALFDYCYC